MSTTCPTCGKQSQDSEFCDHCNADLMAASAVALPPERCPLTNDGVVLTPEQRQVLSFPESSIAIATGAITWRVHWLSNRDWCDRGRLLEKRLESRIAAVPRCEVMEDPQGRWLGFEAAPAPFAPWEEAAREEPLEELQRLSAGVHSLSLALDSLHKNSYLWLNFDPNALEDAGPLEMSEPLSADWRNLRIVNLDLELFPFQSMPERVRVHPHFAAPEVVKFRVDDIGVRTDVYHLAIFIYYWLARKLPDGLAGHGLENNGFTLPFLRVFNPALPVGILPVLSRGLAPHPRDRYPTPNALAHALDECIIKAHQRKAFAEPVRWDVGGNTRAGRSKTELQRGNEDSVLVRDEDRYAFALVADGVSTCDVGSGMLASTMTTIVIENALVDGCSHDAFPEVITSAAQRGSQGLLEWALAHQGREALIAGKDLMGTTLTVAWLQDREVSLANLGDSRAYLITDELVEQLTVDGDLASDLLAQGAAPEEVRELGGMARALRECVGGCTITDNGEPGVSIQSSTPKVLRWPLLPGDVIVLCTDGLVEEGFFLEPAHLAQIVRAGKARPAAELALELVEAADALQRVPSIVEPEGFGDNISCVVIKISEA